MAGDAFAGAGVVRARVEEGEEAVLEGALVFGAIGGDTSLAATGYNELFFWRR